ncbi:putative quinol monooxygenase [Croceicoccus marinus]|uniref:Antibiotic biosynthesis monooxygenase n=1 Tax=Croceicoccus marinus TaxID=450378 RepID=A0A1Z1FGS2_9SPHN|nr:putative quinol monooxygenase [Croceicoccus marinus]ARU17920.1 antibiotic biosynthesis monooxygenase [Croceicoccus marinus]
MIAILMTVLVKPGKAERFAELVTQLRKDVHANEPDTLVFEVLRDNGAANRFHFVEVFADEAAKERHANMDYHLAMSDEGWACLAEDPMIRECDPLGSFARMGAMQ